MKISMEYICRTILEDMRSKNIQLKDITVINCTLY